MFHSVEAIIESENLHQLKTNFQKIGKWVSFPASIVAADVQGNIAYSLLASAPVRANDYPHSGVNVFDGTNTDHDWVGLVDISDLPFTLNPKKGYYITANHRIIPENSKYDIGGHLPATGRARRLVEMFEEKLEKGHKFDYKDIIEMQLDEVDVVARGLAPHIVTIAKRAIQNQDHGFSED